MRRYCCIPWLVFELGCPLAILAALGWLAWRTLLAAHEAWLRFTAVHTRSGGGVILWLERAMPVPLTLVKLIAFALLVVLLYLIARLVARRKQRVPAQSATPPQPALPVVTTALRSSAFELPPVSAAAVSVAPISVAPISVANDALCIPPRIHNYHFAHTELVRGPADPRDFHDDFFVEMEEPAGGPRFTEQFTVATPSGLARLMREEGVAHLFPENLLLISNFNLCEMLTAVVSRYADFRPEAIARQHLTR
jgi:hypothetical protein